MCGQSVMGIVLIRTKFYRPYGAGRHSIGRLALPFNGKLRSVGSERSRIEHACQVLRSVVCT